MTDGMGSSYSNIANPNIHTVDAADISSTNSSQRILPRQVSTGALRGTQMVGYGDVKIDGSNDRITLGSTTNTLGQQAQTLVGKLSSSVGDQSFGLKVIDASGAELLIGILPDGKLGMQIIDVVGNEVVRAGFLPISGIYGWVTATSGNSLEGQV